MDYYETMLGNDYESRPLTVNEALRRSRTFTVNLLARETDPALQLPAKALDVVKIKDPVSYPEYALDYDAGTTLIRLPHEVADPTPVRDQHLYTSLHPNDDFSHIDLPALLFRIDPPEDLFTPENDNRNTEPVPSIIDASTDDFVRNQSGIPLRYFSFLPRYVGEDLSDLLLEYWFCLDSRLEMNDIQSRRLPNPIKDVMAADMTKSANARSMGRSRGRQRLASFSWQATRPWPSKADVQTVGQLSPTQICFNTTMEVDLIPGRLLMPVFGHHDAAGKSIGLADSGLPLDCFLQNVRKTVPRRIMIGAVLLCNRIQYLGSHLID